MMIPSTTATSTQPGVQSLLFIGCPRHGMVKSRWFSGSTYGTPRQAASNFAFSSRIAAICRSLLFRLDAEFIPVANPNKTGRLFMPSM